MTGELLRNRLRVNPRPTYFSSIGNSHVKPITLSQGKAVPKAAFWKVALEERRRRAV